MTTTTPRIRRSVRSLGRMTQAQASAWMAVHGSEIGGTRGEFDGISTTGTLDHPVMGDGWDVLPWQSTRTRPERSYSERTLRDGTTITRLRGAAARTAPRITRRDQAGTYAPLTDEQMTPRQPQRGGGSLSDPDRIEVEWVDHHRRCIESYEIHPQVEMSDDLPTGSLSEPIDYSQFDYEHFASATRAERWSYPITVSRGRIHLTTVPESFAQVGARFGYVISAPLDTADRMAGQRARRVAITQMDRFGRLLPDAPLLGQIVSRELWFDRRRGYYAEQHRRRDIHIADAFSVEEDSEMTSDELVGDSTRVEMIALEDLRQLLRSQGVTDLEMEALERSAAGVAVPDRHCLRRARERAGRIYTQWQRLEYSFAWSPA